MVSVGRVFCVALPFLLLVASIICLLIAGLTGITSHDLYLFRVNLTDLEVNPASVSGLVDKLKDGVRARQSAADVADAVLSTNITAADLGLADIYDINLWGYCSQPQQGQRVCTKAQFDWASRYLNTTSLEGVGKALGQEVKLPKEVTESLKAFKEVTKWTEVVYVIAMIALGVELVFGFFTACSRAVSCCTWVFSTVAFIAVGGFAAMVTAMSVIVVGAIEASAKWYGVKGSVNTSFLAVAWLGFAFALAAGAFWIFTICCCKPERRAHKRHGSESTEKFVPAGSYAPLHDDRAPAYNQTYNQSYGPPRHQSTAPRHDMAYEPYRAAV